MIQYISGILSKFTQKQRITALILLLISIVIITLGPKWISTLSPDTKESQIILKRQDTQIKSLSTQIDSCNVKIIQLNQQIVFNQQECTNTIIKREREIWKEIDALETQMKSQDHIVKSSPKMAVNPNSENDEVLMSTSEMIFIPPNDNKKLIKNLEKLKKKIVKH